MSSSKESNGEKLMVVMWVSEHLRTSDEILFAQSMETSNTLSDRALSHLCGCSSANVPEELSNAETPELSLND